MVSKINKQKLKQKSAAFGGTPRARALRAGTLGYSVAFNSCFQPSTQCFVIPTEANVGLNEEQDMQYTEVTLDGTPINDDLSLLLSSPAINSGPIQGTGPGFYTNWTDVDGSRNDRGYTGGSGASN